MSTQRKLPVMVAIDGSRTHLSTVDLGVGEAIRRGRPLVIVHVWPGRYIGPLRSPGPMPTELDGQHLLEVADQRARHHAPGLQVTTQLLNGSVSAVLTRVSAQAHLLVIGHRDEVATRPSWGSTAAYLAHHSTSPLLVRRGNAPEQGPVVLAASARQGATATARCAYEEAALSNARLVALHVRTDQKPPKGADPGRAEADRRLAVALDAVACRYPDVAVERLVIHDLDIAYTVERASQRGRLLVAGMGRMGRFAEMLYGSLATPFKRDCVCPVLLVPPGWCFPLNDRARSVATTG
jgi:nucleotide-binding universal stress UspA family protein